MGRGDFLSGTVGPAGVEYDEFVRDVPDVAALMWERIWLGQLPACGLVKYSAETPERKREIVDGFRKVCLGICRRPFEHGELGACDCPEAS